jgi:hypothetical protein
MPLVRDCFYRQNYILDCPKLIMRHNRTWICMIPPPVAIHDTLDTALAERATLRHDGS